MGRSIEAQCCLVTRSRHWLSLSHLQPDKRRSITPDTSGQSPRCKSLILHTQLLIPQLACINIDIPLHICDQSPREGQSRIKDCDHGQARWPADMFPARAVFRNQNRGVIGEFEGRTKLCGLTRYPEKIDRKQEAKWGIVNSFNCGIEGEYA